MHIDLQRRGLLAATAAAVTLPRLGEAAGNDIVVGQIGPFTGMPAPDAPELNQGIKAAFAQINAAGGVAGRRLTLFELDDGNKEDGFVRQFTEAMKHRPVALLAPVGARAIQRMLDDKLLDQADTVVLNAIPGADSLRSPGHDRLFHVRAGDRQQVDRIVRHAATLGITHMAVLYQDVPIGLSGFDEAEHVAGALGMRLSSFVVSAEATVLTEVAGRAAVSPAQSVLVVGSPRFAADAIVALRKAAPGKSLYTLSYASSALIRKLDAGAGRGVALAQVVPNPNGNKVALQRAFEGAMKLAGGDFPAGSFTVMQLEGYVTARVLAEGLRRTSDLSASGLARSLRTMGDCDLGGYRVNFAKGNVGSSFVDIAVIARDGQLMY